MPHNKQFNERVANITIRHGSATVDCSDAPLLLPLLECHGVKFKSEGPEGHSAFREVLEAHHLDRKDRLVVREGLVSLVAAALRSRGWRVEIADERKFESPAFETNAVLKQAVDADCDFLTIVDREPVGLLLHEGTVDLINFMALICRYYRRANILILTATRSRAWHLRMKLWREIGTVQLAAGAWGKRDRIVVAPYCHIDEPRSWDIILFPDAEELGNDGVLDKMISPIGIGAKRVYAFAHRRTRVSARQNLAITTVAGPVIFSPVPEPADVHVVFVRPKSDTRADRLTGLEYKRAYWHCVRRNEAIAEVAAAAGDMDRLRKHGLFLDMAGPPPRFGRVTVLVESPEHGRELQRLLAGWALLTLSPGQEQAEPGAGEPLGRIATLAFAAEHGVAADLLIRADGEGPLEIPGFPPANDSSADGRAYLIDVVDDDRHARREARRRQADYVARGWFVDRSGIEASQSPKGRKDRTAKAAF